MKELQTEEVKQVQTDILKKVDAWCREHGIRYFLAYGTLLGAVRHQGYIPWDDDVDIAMLRPDYERFLKEFNQTSPEGVQVLHSSIDPNFPYEFAKVHHTGTKLEEHTGIPYSIGINIDVFVLDSIPDAAPAPAEFLRKSRTGRTIMSWKLILDNRERRRSGVKRMGVAVIKGVAGCFSVQWCTRGYNRLARSYDAPGNEWVADLCQRWFKANEVMRQEWFEDTVELNFEGRRFIAPAHYDEVLTAWYGDYMQLPPVEERVTHHDYKAYSEE